MVCACCRPGGLAAGDIRALLFDRKLWPIEVYAVNITELLAADPRFALEMRSGVGSYAVLQGMSAAEEAQMQMRAVCDAAVEELQKATTNRR